MQVAPGPQVVPASYPPRSPRRQRGRVPKPRTDTDHTAGRATTTHGGCSTSSPQPQSSEDRSGQRARHSRTLGASCWGRGREGLAARRVMVRAVPSRAELSRAEPQLGNQRGSSLAFRPHARPRLTAPSRTACHSLSRSVSRVRPGQAQQRLNAAQRSTQPNPPCPFRLARRAAVHATQVLSLRLQPPPRSLSSSYFGSSSAEPQKPAAPPLSPSPRLASPHRPAPSCAPPRCTALHALSLSLSLSD